MLNKLLSLNKLTTGYDNKIVSQSISLDVYPSELICILGPNGVGKSTLLKTIAKLLNKKSGDIFFNTNSIESLDTKSLSKYLSVVLTDRIIIEYMNVWEFISLGRFPYTNLLGTLKDNDKLIINQIINQLQIEHLQNNELSNLSDGQRQRVMIARALVQDTGLVILDEPTAFLDLPSKVELMNLLSKLCQKNNTSFLVSTHDLDLALTQADRIWIIDKEGNLHDGSPEDLILKGVFNQVFDSEQLIFNKETSTFINKSKSYKSISLKSNGIRKIWIEKALKRIGFQCNEKENNLQIVDLETSLNVNNKKFDSIYSLCQYLQKSL
ncbi:MAG: hypothetical protein COB02_07355 [Candidatus Cloacimonadota bacterium]|nr:MAG: hypothetical protein COB02_07355 [Candidatus Cloacimonadota bacterium]